MKSASSAISRAREHSDAKLAQLRASLNGLVPAKEVVLTCGSYARREASAESDIDFFVITKQAAPAAEQLFEGTALPWFDDIRMAIGEIVPIEPSEDGAFSNVEAEDAMLHNIGGERDSNTKMTRRMLFLLEGEWLFNEAGLKRVRRKILERYIGSGISDHQLALFLLNDVIRFYRTMAVDYEFKTGEGPTPKPWGIRNIKLVFSRKLLYASGIFSVAMTADKSHHKKIETLETLFDVPVIDRMAEICGQAKFEPALASYNRFLDRLEEPDVRRRLKELRREERENPLFRELKNEGHNFTRELMKLFEDTFDSTHPIRRAIIF